MSARKLMDDCFTHDRDRLRHGDVIALLKERLHPVVDASGEPLSEALGRVLAEDCAAPRPIPAHDNAAVDGYAVRHADLNRSEPTSLPIALRLAAGVRHAYPVHASGTATRIFTGAVMPTGADSVIMQEDCDVELNGRGEPARVTIPPKLKEGANRRRAGEDVRKGETLMSAGDILRPQDLARLASAGIGRVRLFDKLKLAFFSTGDELHAADRADLPAGAVYDANQPMLLGLATALPVEAHALGILPDRPGAVEGALADAASKYDVIVTSGGASKGEEDHLRAALQKLGACHLWQLAIKPGRPMMMGQVGQTPVFGLPGNPVAVFVCWVLYVYPSLLRLAGAPWRKPERIMLPAGFTIPRKKQDRREFYRGWLETAGGRTVMRKYERDGSGLIAGLQAATGLIEVPEEADGIAEGDMLAYWPLAQFGIR
ncbi:MAG: gephyrin-like molybdotransferase Glp [Rhodomicrobiaceae bacterium]